MEQFSFRQFSPGLVHLEATNDVQLIFDDSYICYVSKIDVFQSSLVLVFTNGTVFHKKIFSRTCTLRGKMMYIRLLMTHIYSM